MDKAIRTTLRTTVTECRRILEAAIAQLLQGQFGIHPDGRVEELSQLTHLSADDRAYRAEVVAHLEHIRVAGLKPADAAAQLVREVAFTHLNRLCAYKLMEQRKLIRESVSRGLGSNGFKFYLAAHPADEELWSGGQQDLAYRHFLEHLAGTLAAELGALFSPTDLANRLFPPQRILDQVLDMINSADLKPVWAEDETIGWVYQYFTPKELRDQARKESQAPRNSYELAFRNQFFTPRYVVEFLVDNTLGQTWYEMRHGQTALIERCRYLVRRPGAIFLAPGEEPPAPEDSSNLDPAELLHRTPHIAHRARRDPAGLRILDPACGSGHFLLYCFDLLETIYAESYDDPELGPPLQARYPSAEEFRRQVPRLILERNLHGIDIDLRATQIAALALWLRAQRSWQEQGLKPEQRPLIARTNIVCAEPMPGEADMLAEFAADLEPPVLGQLVRGVFEKMRLAGDAGTLLKIEEEISGAVESARQQWLTRPPAEQMSLFGDAAAVREQQAAYNLAGITGDEFWDEAEQRVLDALEQYAEHAAAGTGFQRRLFAQDAARGFAFIDVCRRRYDVVLMNPPFGAGSKPAQPYIEQRYPRTKNDVYAAFVERGLNLLRKGGQLGAITSRTGFFLTSFQKWREEILLREARPTVVADLGAGVLDTAMVETAAYCLEAR